jgi:hypothetical protein
LFSKNGFNQIYGNENINCLFSVNNNNVKIENDYMDVNKYLKKTEKWKFVYFLNPTTLAKKILSLIKPAEISTFRSKKEAK